MDVQITINLILVALMILATAFFVGAEFAILKVRMSRIDQLISEGNKKAVMAKKVANNLDYYLSACQLGITVTALILGALGEPTVERLLRPAFDYFALSDAAATALSYAIALAIVTFLHVVIGELAPKTLAIQFAEKMTLLLAPPLYWFGKIMSPFIRVLNGSAQQFLKLFKLEPSGHSDTHSEEELKLIMAESFQSGEINQTELTYLKNIFVFDDRLVKTIMIPKERIVSVDYTLSRDDLFEAMSTHEFTRYPVTEAASKDRFLGFINTKEILTSMAAGRNPEPDSFIHHMPSFPETASLRKVWTSMQQQRTHMAIITDKHGNTCGLVTMEDILEEIVGKIDDDSLEMDAK